MCVFPLFWAHFLKNVLETGEIMTFLGPADTLPPKNPPNLSRFFLGIFCLFLGKKPQKWTKRAQNEGGYPYIYIYICQGVIHVPLIE